MITARGFSRTAVTVLYDMLQCTYRSTSVDVDVNVGRSHESCFPDDRASCTPAD